MAKPPRKEGDPDVRDSRVVTYFTPQDAEFLSEMARNLGMSRSSLIVSVMERLIIGGFSARVGAKIAFQLQKRAKERGSDTFQGLYFGIRPLPPLPDDGLTAGEKEEVVAELNQLKTC